jgi:hypothetical protein
MKDCIAGIVEIRHVSPLFGLNILRDGCEKPAADGVADSFSF